MKLKLTAFVVLVVIGIVILWNSVFSGNNDIEELADDGTITCHVIDHKVEKDRGYNKLAVISDNCEDLYVKNSNNYNRKMFDAIEDDTSYTFYMQSGYIVGIDGLDFVGTDPLTNDFGNK